MTAPRTSRGREIAGRLALAVGGIVAGLLALEIALQAAALVVRLARPADAVPERDRRPRILCAGDSNTYGLWVERDESWPRVLERRWNAGAATPIDVVNVGVPGTNSSALLATLPQLLELTHPSVVLVMVGANDFWTEPVPPPALDLDDDLVGRVRTQSRVVSLLRMIGLYLSGAPDGVTLRRTDDPTGGSATTRLGHAEIETRWKRRDVPVRGWEKELRRNLITILGQIRASAAVPVLVTYASDDQTYARANQALREVARMTQVLLVDVTPTFADRCRQDDCPDLLRPDGHPTAAGYSLLGELVSSALAHADLPAMRSAPAAGPTAPAPASG